MGLPPHLGGHCGTTHIDTGALRYFYDIHNCRRLLDVGCGPGGQVKAARDIGYTHCAGIDGDPAVEPDILHDFTTGTVRAVAESVAREPDEPALVWCEFNAESEALAAAIPDAVEVRGSDPPEVKAERLLGFADGTHRVLVTKPSIAGFGMNWQHCARVYFCGASHSYEQTYQAIRRCWRFGQKRPVDVYTCVAETERAVIANLRRKHDDAEEMGQQMLAHVTRAAYQTGRGARREWNDYKPVIPMEVPAWL